MAKFIKLTAFETGSPTWVNTAQIFRFGKAVTASNASYVIQAEDDTDSGTFKVRETPEQILSLIEDTGKP